jgi:hypothetical protein
MAWTAEVQAINQRLQFGLEVTPGVNVAATKLLQAFDLTMGSMADVSEFFPTGRKYAGIVIENAEWVEGTFVDSPLDYNNVVYLISGVAGAPTIGAHGASATAKDWTWTPPLTGSVQPQTYTIEQGDTATRAHKVNYGLVSEFAYKGDRKTGIKKGGKLLAQALQTNITMTGGPTAVALAPSAGKHFNVYLDSTSAGLGTTQLLRVLNIDYAFANIYGMFFALNRAQLGFTAHVDLKPKTTMKLMLEADATGDAQLVALQSGATQFLRIQGQGLIIDNLQTVTIGGGATGGTFTLSYKGFTGGPITYSAGLTSAAVNTIFQAYPFVGANCTVTGSAGGPYVFTFSGGLVADMSPVGVQNVSLSGGTPTVSAVAQAYNTFQHDMAVKVAKPNPFQDKDGVYANDWEFTIVEDPTWAASQKFLVTTLLTAL